MTSKPYKILVYITSVMALASGGSAAWAQSCNSGEDHPHQLSKGDVKKLADAAIQRLLKADGIPNFTFEDLVKKTGVPVKASEEKSVKRDILALMKKHPGAAAKLKTTRCAKYDACSLNRNLSGATGEELAMYKIEKGEDGKTFSDRVLPKFQAQSLSGKKVSTNALVGKPIVLTFLAGHCSHSLDSLPILEKLQRDYAKKGLSVVGVFVNSGSVEDMNGWINDFKPSWKVLVHTPISLGDTIGSHLVPTYFFVDQKGQVKEKLVGYKSQKLIDERARALLGLKTALAKTDRAPILANRKPR